MPSGDASVSLRSEAFLPSGKRVFLCLLFGKKSFGAVVLEELSTS
jgi:hypothetical protein